MDTVELLVKAGAKVQDTYMIEHRSSFHTHFHILSLAKYLREELSILLRVIREGNNPPIDRSDLLDWRGSIGSLT